MKPEFRTHLTEIIKNRPGTTMAQLCRIVNERGLSYCNKKECYANSRQKAKWGKREQVCLYRLQTVIAELRKMEVEGIFILKFGKYTDIKQPRGWDFMTGVYFPDDLSVEPAQSVLASESKVNEK